MTSRRGKTLISRLFQSMDLNKPPLWIRVNVFLEIVNIYTFLFCEYKMNYIINVWNLFTQLLFLY